MNLIPMIRETLGLEIEEEFQLLKSGGISYNSKYRFAYNDTLQWFDPYTSCWNVSSPTMLEKIIYGQVAIKKLPFRPEEGEVYYLVLSDRDVDDTTFDPYCCYDLAFYTLGNCFRTKEEITPDVLEETWQKCYGAYFQDDKQDGAQQ